MKQIPFDLGNYTMYPSNGGYQERKARVICPQCGNDMGSLAPNLSVDETYIAIEIYCPSCGKRHTLWMGHGAKPKCEPESSPAPIAADF
jgi:predicted RNA-binding Zn-ribbon protein involved in translation (DUF1610 family)